MSGKIRSVCFVHDLWCDGKKNGALSNNQYNILGSSQSITNGYQIAHVYLDKAFQEDRVHIDDMLLDKYLNYDAYVMCFLGDSFMNPSARSLRVLSKKAPIVFMWPDTVWPWIKPVLKAVDPYAYMHVAWDGCAHRQDIQEVTRKFTTHPLIDGVTPQDDSVFKPQTKAYSVCFVGSAHGDRLELLKYFDNLKHSFIHINGQRMGTIPYKAYADIIGQSQYCLNFVASGNNLYHQMKGRLYEAAASATEVINIDSPRLIHKEPLCSIELDTKLLTPEQAIAYVKSIDEDFDRNRHKIVPPTALAVAAHSTYHSTYYSQYYWQKLLNVLETGQR
jgi:hypothetical protein